MSKITREQLVEVISELCPCAACNCHCESQASTVKELFDDREAEIRGEYRKLVEAAVVWHGLWKSKRVFIHESSRLLYAAIQPHLPRKPKLSERLASYGKQYSFANTKFDKLAKEAKQLEAALQQAGVEV